MRRDTTRPTTGTKARVARRPVLQAAAIAALVLGPALTGLTAPPAGAQRDQTVERLAREAFDATPVTVIVDDPIGTLSPATLAAHQARAGYRFRHMQELTVPGDRLGALLARLPAEAVVRLPYPHQPLAVTSQGVALTGAGDMQALGQAGFGTQVGIIDLGFSDLAASQASGDLPLTLTAVDYTGSGLAGGNHGTQVAEIVHDMAPAATLFLARIGNELQMAQAVNDMAAAGVKVIVHSVAWFNANFYDGSGPLCDIADRARSLGMLWINAVGNHRNRHYLGNFTDGNGDLRHEFAAGTNFNTVAATAGSRISLYLNWNGYPLTSVDYDLYLYDGNPDSGGQIIAQSLNRQSASGAARYPYPTELLDIVAPVTATYYIVVRKVSAATPNLALSLFANGQDLGTKTVDRSIVAPADCASVIATGATGLDDSLQSYSSEGPTTDGRNKPELAAPTNVQTSKLLSFGGTSAAAPHAAGAAALLRAANPALSVTQLATLLAASTHDLGPVGYDSRSGFGRVSLDADGDGFNHDRDNCPRLANPDQTDSDRNGVGDACEPPRLSGFWPGSGPSGTKVWLFGDYFHTGAGATRVGLGGVSAPLVQTVSPELLIFFVPSGPTSGAIVATTSQGSASSSPKLFNGSQSPGLRIDGIWPARARVGQIVYVFGAGFVPTLGGTVVTINGTRVFAVQLIDPSLLLFFVPSGATSGPLCVTVSGAKVCTPIIIDP